MTTDKSEEFKLLYEMLKAYYNGFIDAAFKVAGFFLLATGWLLTSEDARGVLSVDEIARFGALVAVVVAWLFYAAASWRVRFLSDRTFLLLVGLKYMDEQYYSNHRITRRTLGLFVSAIFGLALFLSFLLLRLRPEGIVLCDKIILGAVLLIYVAGALFLWRNPITGSAASSDIH